MFKCYAGHVTRPGEKLHKFVLETRSKVYPPRPYANDPGGLGEETVKEVKLCESHYTQITNTIDLQRAIHNK